MQVSPSHKHSIGIFEAQKNNFAKHNEAHKNLPHAKRVVHLESESGKPMFPKLPIPTKGSQQK